MFRTAEINTESGLILTLKRKGGKGGEKDRFSFSISRDKALLAEQTLTKAVLWDCVNLHVGTVTTNVDF